MKTKGEYKGGGRAPSRNLKVVTVRTGNTYPTDKIYRLRQQVRDNTNQRCEFICVTENFLLFQGMTISRAPVQVCTDFARLGLFSSAMQNIKDGDRVLFIDAGAEIKGSIDELISGKLPKDKDFEFWLLQDEAGRDDTSIMYWIHGRHGNIFTHFRRDDLFQYKNFSEYMQDMNLPKRYFKKEMVTKFQHLKKPEDVPSQKVVLFDNNAEYQNNKNLKWIE